MSESLASFESLLHDLLKKKPPISANSTAELTRLASLLTVDLVPRLVSKIHNFFQTSPQSYRLSALYLVDSICKSKNDLKSSYTDGFSALLPSMVRTFLKDASDKDRESSKKLVRIWAEKRLFSDRVIASIGHTYKNELSHDVPGTAELMASYPPVLDSPPSSSQPSSGTSNNLEYGYPTSTHSPSSHTLPPQHAPAPSNASSSIVDDLSSLGDLDALLGLPSATPSAPLPSTSTPTNSYYPPLPFPLQGMPPQNAAYPPSHTNSYPPPRGDYRQGQPQYPGQLPPTQPSYGGGAPPQSFGPPRGDSSSYRPPYTRQDGSHSNSNYGAQGSVQVGAQSYNNRQERSERPTGPREEPPIPTGPAYSTTLFVGSLPSNATESELRELFAKFGNLKKVTIKPDKNYAFVPFATFSEAQAARAALDGRPLGDKTLRIRWARSDLYRTAQVDPETGLLSFGGDGEPQQRGNGNNSYSGHNNNYDRASHGIPRGLQPKVESSFVGGSVPHSTGPSSYGAEDQYKGKRRFDGDQPMAEKRRADSGGFETMSSYSGR